MKRKPVVYTFRDAKDQADFAAFALGQGLRIDKSKIYDDELDKEKPVAYISDIESIELQVYRGRRVMDIAEEYIRQREA